MSVQNQADVFINGKAQIIEMLQYMTPDEKRKLLANIKHRNPILADELMEQSFTFGNLTNLSDSNLNALIANTPAPIMGMALKNNHPEFQKRVLAIAPRNYAEEAYNVMVGQLKNEEHVHRARNKVLSILMQLKKKNLLSL